VAVPLNPAEIARFEAESSWMLDRLGEEGMGWIRQGVIPTRDVNRVLQCAFLDDDGLCSMQKQFGHEFLPQTCQSFPFGFVSNERGELVAQMSQLCPAIRDGYGSLITVERLRDKLAQKGGAERMSKAMATRHGRILSQAQYMRIVQRWIERIDDTRPPLDILLELYDWTKAFEDALPGTSEKPDDASVDEVINRADATKLVRFQLSTSTSMEARVLRMYVLGGLSYPTRVQQEHRLDRPTFLQRLRSLWSKTKWALGRGKVDLLYVENPVPLRRVDVVKRFLSSEKARPISRLMRLVIDRRQIFRDPRHLMEVIMDMAMATVIISRYARCRAAAEGRFEVDVDDVREGISIAELTLLGHAAQRGAGVTLRNTRRSLIGARENFLRLLASENEPS